MLDDQLLEELLHRQAAAAASRPADPLRRAARLAVLAGAVPAVVLGLVGLLAGVVVAVVVFVVVLVVVTGALLAAVFLPGDDRVTGAVGGRPADPVADARLLNLVDGLCTATGLRPPRVRVVDSDGLNALAAGRHPNHAVLAVTSGLLSALSRVELEGVLAEELMAIRGGRMVPATVVASLPATLTWLVRQERVDDLAADLAAVSLTRYPPGLRGALEKLREQGTAVPTLPALDGLWLAAPSRGPTAGRTPHRVQLAERIEALAAL